MVYQCQCIYLMSLMLPQTRGLLTLLLSPGLTSDIIIDHNRPGAGTLTPRLSYSTHVHLKRADFYFKENHFLNIEFTNIIFGSLLKCCSMFMVPENCC